ncbi:ISC2A protein, partial [Oriolus oriolus]|nr:ISC2A protein [Oriolus oriolus]
MAAARLGRLLPGSSVLFLCDLQERFRGSIVAFPQIVAVAARLLQVGHPKNTPKIPQIPPNAPKKTPKRNPQKTPNTPTTPPVCFGAGFGGPRVNLGRGPSQVERALALARLRQAGAFLSTCESLLLLLLRDAAHPHFKQILPLIKEPPPDTGLILGGPLGVLGGL